LNPSEAVGGEKAMGGIGGVHCLEMRFGGTKGSLTLPSVTEHCVALAGMQERKTLQGMAPSRRGQRAQLALTLGIAKRPELLILDEPVAALDPLARREFLQGLMEAAAEHELSVVLSSHLVSDLERVCDYLIVLVDSRVRVAGKVDELLATHHRLTGPRRDPTRLPADQHAISASHTDRQTTLIIRTDAPIHDPAWTVSQIGLEDLVLAYMSQPADTGSNDRPILEVQR
jgi:ABC-2 type transport system ATP-binding protein